MTFAGGLSFSRLPTFEAGCRMPAHNTIMAADAYERVHAATGSDRLLLALLIYGKAHGLPNISADQCRVKLASL